MEEDQSWKYLESKTPHTEVPEFFYNDSEAPYQMTHIRFHARRLQIESSKVDFYTVSQITMPDVTELNPEQASFIANHDVAVVVRVYVREKK